MGDNVGDVAGMGADLFESYVGSIIGTMVLGAAFTQVPAFAEVHFDGLGAVYLPLVLAAVGIIMSIIGTFFVKVKDGGNPHTALNIGEFGSAGLMLIASFLIIIESNATLKVGLFGENRIWLRWECSGPYWPG